MKRIAVVFVLAAFFVVTANAQQADAPPAASPMHTRAQAIPRAAKATLPANIHIQVGARGKWVDVQVSRLKANGHTQVNVQLKDHQSTDGITIRFEKESLVLKDRNPKKDRLIA